MIAEPLTWKHLLQVVLIAATIALIVWYRERMHPWFIVAMGLVTFDSVFATVSETLRLDPVLPWWLEIVPIIVNIAAVVIFASLWYYNGDVNREAPS